MRVLAFGQAVLICILYGLCMSVSAAQPVVLKIGLPDHASAIAEEYAEEVAKVYEQFGYQWETSRAPARRILIQADRGDLDGVILVPGVVRDHFYNLVQINVSVTSIDMMAFSMPELAEVKHIDDLKGLKVGYLLGYETTERLLQNIGALSVRSYDLLFGMILKHRLDIALALRRETFRFVEHHSEFAVMKMHPTPIIRVPLYHFINRKYEGLVEQVEEALTRQLATGELEKRISDHTPKSPFHSALDQTRPNE
ncbi:MAG: hypothetical protein MI864_17480 [Pseudomonadales bacterium]|nr:hypothetical protein [Pseudomonadales bacterium]